MFTKLKKITDSVSGLTLNSPKDLSWGDYSIPVFTLDDDRKKILIKDISFLKGVEKVEEKNNFLNIILTKEARISGVVKKESTKINTDTVLFEHTSPNPFKPLHIGHIMTNAIGESLSRIYEALGSSVKNVTYNGDIGKHIAKSIWAIRKNGKGGNLNENILAEMYKFGASQYEESAEAKKEIDELNRELYSMDNNLKKIYDEGIKVSNSHFNDVYKVLGTKFDATFLESKTAPVGKNYVEKNLDVFVKDKDGSVFYDGEKDGLHRRVFITSENLPTYETKELGLDVLKASKYSYDKSIVVTAHEQEGMQKVVRCALSKIDSNLAKKKEFLIHGHLRFSDGKMSSRTGKVILGLDFLNIIKDEIIKKSERNVTEGDALRLAVASFKFSILKQEIGKDVVFDLDKETSFSGDTGVYILYTLTRMNSILKNKFTLFKNDVFNEVILLRLLNGFSHSLNTAYSKQSPHPLAQHILSICKEWNRFYEKERIIGDKDQKQKLNLTYHSRRYLLEGIHLLGIKEVKKI